MSLRTIYKVIKDPDTLEHSEYVSLLRDRTHTRTFKKMVRIFDEQIQNISPSESSGLSFAMLATLVGHNAICPTRDSDYVWRTVWAAAKQHQKIANYMLGMLAQWRFAVDARNWVCYSQETGLINDEGEEITRTHYFVDNGK